MRDLPAAARRREALERLADAQHAVLTRGPEGEQEVRDKDGKLVRSEQTVDFIGYKAYVRDLMAQAGLIDPELEAVVERLKKVEAGMAKMERFFGRAGSVVKA